MVPPLSPGEYCGGECGGGQTDPLPDNQNDKVSHPHVDSGGDGVAGAHTLLREGVQIQVENEQLALFFRAGPMSSTTPFGAGLWTNRAPPSSYYKT